MATFLISAGIFGLVMVGMALGVIFGRPPIKGSCGGIGALGIDTACEICGGDAQRCEEQTRGGDAQSETPEQFYPADGR